MKRKVVEAWQKCHIEISGFVNALNGFPQQGREKSETFLYWDRFIKEIAPVPRYLTRSFREGNWTLHLCFAFDRVNYKSWLPLYYEDCLALQQRSPEIHDSFME